MCFCRSYCSLCIGMLCGKKAVTEVSHDCTLFKAKAITRTLEWLLTSFVLFRLQHLSSGCVTCVQESHKDLSHPERTGQPSCKNCS